MPAAEKTLSALDMMIAAHAAPLNAVLVTNDKASPHATGVHTIAKWATV